MCSSDCPESSPRARMVVAWISGLPSCRHQNCWKAAQTQSQHHTLASSGIESAQHKAGARVQSRYETFDAHPYSKINMRRVYTGATLVHPNPPPKGSKGPLVAGSPLWNPQPNEVLYYVQYVIFVLRLNPLTWDRRCKCGRKELLEGRSAKLRQQKRPRTDPPALRKLATDSFSCASIATFVSRIYRAHWSAQAQFKARISTHYMTLYYTMLY